ncbi:hypothetical protein ABTY59_31150 [Streptomyces sp. NPDC096079]|uniref:hypothetical protein n=1 Tax=Streptomyces sp. NPDC096079 TaxID=3155820 RepID=UPI00331D4262
MNAEMRVGHFARDAHRHNRSAPGHRHRPHRTSAENADPSVQHDAAHRAENLTHAVLLGDRLGEYHLRLLRGTDLDPAPATV